MAMLCRYVLAAALASVITAEPCVWPDSSIPHDQWGRFCPGPCGTPVPGRGYDNRSYVVRDDCGHLVNSTTWIDGAVDIPVAQLSRPATDDRPFTNGFCELNDQKSCIDSIVNRDYLFMGKGNDVRIYPQCFRDWDGQYCLINGFLEPSLVALINDFDGMQKAAQNLCTNKYGKLYSLSAITLQQLFDAYFGSMDSGAPPSLEAAQFSAAWNCAMGDLGCEIAYCGYSFCDLGNGTTGWYNECPGWDPVTGNPAKVGAVHQSLPLLMPAVGLAVVVIALACTALLHSNGVVRRMSHKHDLGTSLQGSSPA